VAAVGGDDGALGLGRHLVDGHAEVAVEGAGAGHVDGGAQAVVGSLHKLGGSRAE
jgi:hypothetical protein